MCINGDERGAHEMGYHQGAGCMNLKTWDTEIAHLLLICFHANDEIRFN